MDKWLPPHRRLLLAVLWAFLLSGIRQTDWLIAGLSGAFLLFVGPFTADGAETEYFYPVCLADTAVEN